MWDMFNMILPRALGVLAGWGTAALAEKTGIVVDPASVVAVGLTGYAAVHRIASSHFNPGDAATRRVSDAVKTAADTGTVVKLSPPTL